MTNIRKILLGVSLLFFLAAVLAAYFFSLDRVKAPETEFPKQQDSLPVPYQPESLPKSAEKNSSTFSPPLEKAKERATKKPFGVFITKENSPVQPERFAGYHTGTDFEIFPTELNVAIPVKAVCSGELLVKRNASGYGGVIVQSCELDGASITVVYGHMDLSSIKFNAGDKLNTGDLLGNLGADKSAQTDGERKHLHLGFHRGSAVNILGYVNSKDQLDSWLDPCRYVCQ